MSPFRALCADQHPDFRTIRDFRERPLQALVPLFRQVVRLAGRLGLVTREHVAQEHEDSRSRLDAASDELCPDDAG